MVNGQLALIGTGGLPTPRLWETWLAERATTGRFTAKVHHRSPDVVGGPLTDLRGTAGRAIAVRQAIRIARVHGPAATEAAIAAAITAGDSSAHQPSLF